MVLAGNGNLSESFALSPAPPPPQIHGVVDTHAPCPFLSLSLALSGLYRHTPPGPQDKAPKLLGRLNRPASSTEYIQSCTTRTYQPRAAIVCEEPPTSMPPHASLSLSLSLSLVLSLSLSLSLLCVVLCCAVPVLPVLPDPSSSSSSPALLVCVPALPTTTHLPYLPDYNGLMYLVYTILPPVPSSNPGDGPRCFPSWRVALVQIVSTGRLPLRKKYKPLDRHHRCPLRSSLIGRDHLILARLSSHSSHLTSPITERQTSVTL